MKHERDLRARFKFIDEDDEDKSNCSAYEPQNDILNISRAGNPRLAR